VKPTFAPKKNIICFDVTQVFRLALTEIRVHMWIQSLVVSHPTLGAWGRKPVSCVARRHGEKQHQAALGEKAGHSHHIQQKNLVK